MFMPRAITKRFRLRMFNALSLVVMLLLVLLSGIMLGCEGAKTVVPEGFVEQKDSTFAFKAVAPDGTTIAVRQRQNEEKGSLSFWSEVFKREMVEGKGYRLVDTRDVTSSNGIAGQHFVFEVAVEDTPYTYWLALFVSERTITTFEAGTPSADLERHEVAFKTALEGVKAP